MKKDEKRDEPKPAWIQISKDKTRGIVYKIGFPDIRTAPGDEAPPPADRV